MSSFVDVACLDEPCMSLCVTLRSDPIGMTSKGRIKTLMEAASYLKSHRCRCNACSDSNNVSIKNMDLTKIAQPENDASTTNPPLGAKHTPGQCRHGSRHESSWVFEVARHTIYGSECLSPFTWRDKLNHTGVNMDTLPS